MIHHWLGWISLAVCVLLMAKYIGRISGNKTFNKQLRNIHKPLGNAVLAIAALHGGISFLKSPQALIPNLTGALLLVMLVLLARTFYARKKLKAKWFPMHRHIAVVFCVLTAIHIVISFS